ncbi:CsbD family protein [Nocardia sp. CDC153]|uniref:CsbD family protein n=1 Tax=Nocardia sp. CDC153 TaxID=3112167 RepID=UPI002DB8D44B|nr:CsbD family protein [Nocardia sp. CDC153]MEC3953581.1 CsbD family protein [Nocardia sp. CDC153]
MSFSDEIENKAKDLGGKTKEAAGKLAGDDELRAEGKADQLEAGIDKAVGKVKEAVEGAVKTVEDKLGGKR